MLLRDGATNLIQAMPLTEGKIGITTGSVTNVSLIHCAVDGDLTLTFPSGTTATVSLEAGADRSVVKGTSVAVTSGTFDFA